MMPATALFFPTSTPRLFIGFSGHRSVDEKILKPALTEILSAIHRTTEGIPLVACSSAAEGADGHFAEAVLHFKPEQSEKAPDEGIPWVALLPFEKEAFLNAHNREGKPDFSDAGRERSRGLLDKAAMIIELPGSLADYNHNIDLYRGRSFTACTNKTVEECDVLIVAWDGKETERPGGTFTAARYARELRKLVIWVPVKDCEVSIGGNKEKKKPVKMGELQVSVYPERKETVELEAFQTWQWVPFEKGGPTRLKKLCAQATDEATPIGDVSCLRMKLPSGQDGSKFCLQKLAIAERENILKQLRTVFSTKARFHRRWSNRMDAILIVLHQLAILVAFTILILQIGGHGISIWVELIALTLALLLPVAIAHRTRKQWAQNRVNAEILRSVLAVWNFERADTVLSAIALPISEGFQRLLFFWRGAYLSPTVSTPVFHVERKKYLEERIGGQIEYYHKQAYKTRRHKRRLSYSAYFFTGLAIFGSLLLAWHEGLSSVESLLFTAPSSGENLKHHQHVIELLTHSLPLLAAILLSLISAQDIARRAVRYDAMLHYLRKIKARVENCETWEELRQATIDTEKALLFEVWEWNFISRHSWH